MRRVGRLEPSQEHFERHARKRPAGLEAGEDEFTCSAGLHFLKDGECAIRQWDAMLARRLRSSGRDRPDLRVPIDFDPTRGQRLARSRRRKNAELKRTRGGRIALPKLRNEGGDLRVGRRRMMSARELGALWQQLVQMAAPTSRIGFVLPMKPRALAASRTASMRPLRREAVSGARVHRGLRTERTASVSIPSTGVDGSAHNSASESSATALCAFRCERPLHARRGIRRRRCRTSGPPCPPF